MKAIAFFGEKQNLEKVCRKAWEIGNFGSTCIDGNNLDVFTRIYTNAEGVKKLVDYARENSCYTNVPTERFIKETYGFIIINRDYQHNGRKFLLTEGILDGNIYAMDYKFIEDHDINIDDSTALSLAITYYYGYRD